MTSRDADGSTATANGTHLVRVSAEADAPVVSGAATGAEDSVIAVAGHGVACRHGRIRNPGLRRGLWPAGRRGPGLERRLAWNCQHAFGGRHTLLRHDRRDSGLLASITITPPLHSDAGFSLSVLARAIESNPSEVGDVSLLTRDTTFLIPVTINAVADQPNVVVTPVAGDEDTLIPFGTAIATASLTPMAAR